MRYKPEELDLKRLRRDLSDDYMAMSVGLDMPELMFGSFKIDKMSDKELIRFAEREGVKLRRYLL